MNSFEFYTPTKIFFGKGGAPKVGGAIKQYGGTKVLLHYGSDRVLKNGLMDTVIASMKEQGIDYVMLGGVVPNPRLTLVREGAELVKKEKIDFIMAVGGGSVIDSAKGIAMAAANEADVWDIYMGKEPIKAALPTGNILTLAAAGSETSKNTVITNEDGGIKVVIGGDLMRPKFTIMDPELLYTLPPYQTASGVVDIMMHTMDRYFSPPNPPGVSNEMTDRISEQLLKVTMHYGKICMEKPNDYEARSEVMWAGSLSHSDLTGLGLLPDFAPHRLEHELSGKYDVTHGAGLAAVWGAWARYVYNTNVARFVRYGVNVFDLTEDKANPEKTALEAIKLTEDYFKSIDMPINMTALVGKDISDEDIEDMADKCSRGGTITIGNFMKLDKKQMIEIYKSAR
ncbi:MAG: iron-containing alcohol dehydrogenase [Oscillospiraceae bacterium]|nr:iron-containing alcohol dehydrogenase [Oscillospiraceae bacterium]MCL2277821.1 iron-containing alcohol dehydrogenase [Oscillospiraceae bacterium]